MMSRASKEREASAAARIEAALAYKRRQDEAEAERAAARAAAQKAAEKFEAKQVAAARRAEARRDKK